VALQLRWAASILHPSPKNNNARLVDQARVFYARFFSYPLTEEEARRMLAGLPPA
jgi:iron complex transport system substrate-binding protein